jgi:hypothetical protein
MSYKKGMSKARFKATMRFFWTDHWNYERTPEVWVSIISGEITPVHSKGNFMTNGMSNLYRNKQKELLESAIDKLVLEKKLTKEKGANVLAMVQSPDKENALVALHIMAQLKPKKFKKVIYE